MVKVYKVGSTIIAACIMLILGCNSPVVPKPKGYEKMHFPEKKYQVFNASGYPFSFEYPVYGQIKNNLNYFGDNKQTNNWINIQFPENGATIYVSYRPILANQLDTFIRDAYTFANNHNSKASSIEDSVFVTDHGVYGVLFHIGGNVATSYQFLLTDSTHHFFRGALYFDATPNEDSLAPANEFFLKDLKHLVNTFRWK
jgi:gliding motility-associated lipoprotein GldD